MEGLEYFTGKTILLTGGSSGLGLALLKILTSSSECRVILAGRSLSKLSDICRQYHSSKCSVAPVALDLESPDTEIATAISNAYSIFGCIDVLINCAGMGFRGEIEQTLPEVHRRIMQVDYFGQVAVIRSLLREWKQHCIEHWDIVQVCSVQGYIGLGGRAPYSAAKHALVGFIDSLRVEQDGYPRLGGKNVTLASPGYIATNHSANALTADGSMYENTDESTAAGYDPFYVASRILQACASGKKEVVIADIKVRILLCIRSIFPALCFRVLRNKYINSGESLIASFFRWIIGW